MLPRQGSTQTTKGRLIEKETIQYDGPSALDLESGVKLGAKPGMERPDPVDSHGTQPITDFPHITSP
jgi:hypothetical protein